MRQRQRRTVVYKNCIINNVKQVDCKASSVDLEPPPAPPSIAAGLRRLWQAIVSAVTLWLGGSGSS